VAVVGFCASIFIRDTGVRAAEKQGSALPWTEGEATFRRIRGNRYLLLSIFALAYFLFLGGFVQQKYHPVRRPETHMEKDFANYIFLALALESEGVRFWRARSAGGASRSLGADRIVHVRAALLLLLFPGHSLAWS